MRKVYLDHMANTPPDLRVIDSVCGALSKTYGNPLNLHDFGESTANLIDDSRSKVAALIGAQSKEIIFTSCGSESNNFAIKGIAKAYEKKGKHIISSTIEHFSVLYSLKDLEKEGFNITYVNVGSDGMINPDDVMAAITPQTSLITITHASNEIGTIEPVEKIGKIAKEKGIVFHVDGVQTIGTIPVNVTLLNADAITFSANQFYGPTGVAALYLRKGVRILPYILGGTQEDGRRAGTNNIGGIAGFAKASEIALAEMDDRIKKLIPLRDKLLTELPKTVPDFFVTGHLTNRLPNHASGCVKFIEGESMSMLLNMDGIAVSTGSACVSKALKASHVLIAIGISPENVHGSLVFSLGKDNLIEDVDYVIEKLPPIVKRLREMSPLSAKG